MTQVPYSAWFTMGIMWLLLGGLWTPMMWRWHVKLPRERRRLSSQPANPRNKRYLRRIDQQTSHFWASREGKILFVLYTLLQLGATLFLILNLLMSD